MSLVNLLDSKSHKSLKLHNSKNNLSKVRKFQNGNYSQCNSGKRWQQSEVVQNQVEQMMGTATKRCQLLLSKCRKIWMIESSANGAIGSLQRRLVRDICLIVSRSIRQISLNKEVVNRRFQLKEEHKQGL